MKRKRIAIHLALQLIWLPAFLARADQNSGPLSAGNVGAPSSVSGSILNASTGEPVVKATVALAPAGGALHTEQAYTASSDGSGHFEIRDVSPGNYKLTVRCRGFLPADDGPDHQRLAVTVGAGQTTSGISLRLTPEGVLTGKIIDADGDPVEQATVRIQPAGNASASTTPSGRMPQVQTNDLGVYRVFGLRPGHYYVSATIFQGGYDGAPVSNRSKAASIAYAQTYYPGTTDAAQAAPVVVAPGQEVEADVQIRKIQTLQLSGLISYNGQPLSHVPVMVYPASAPKWDEMDRHSGAADENGEWHIAGLAPGSYILSADLLLNGERIGARLPIDVDKENLEGVSVKVQPYPALVGEIVNETGEPVPNVQKVKVEISPLRNLSSMRFGWAMVDQSGHFVLESACPDGFELKISGLPENYYVKSVKAGGLETTDNQIKIGFSNSVPVEVFVSPNGATIEGAVVDAGGHAAGETTVLLEPAGDPQKRTLQVQTDQSGRFRRTGLKPGDYLVSAVLSDSPERFSAKSASAPNPQTVSLEAGGVSRVTLKASSSR